LTPLLRKEAPKWGLFFVRSCRCHTRKSRGSGPMAEDGRQGFVEPSEIRFATFADATTAVGCSTLRLAEASLQGSVLERRPSIRVAGIMYSNAFL